MTDKFHILNDKLVLVIPEETAEIVKMKMDGKINNNQAREVQDDIMAIRGDRLFAAFQKFWDEQDSRPDWKNFFDNYHKEHGITYKDKWGLK